MADCYTEIRQRERILIYSPKYVPDSGTLTFASGTVSLFDASGEIAGEIEDTPVTDFTSGASAEPQGWWLMDMTDGVDGLDLDPGDYTLVFGMVDSATPTKIRKSVVAITIKTANGP